jgi:hypothetical protein
MRRRVVLSAAAVMALSAGVSAAPAAAYAPSPSAAPGQTVCIPTAKDVTEISGLVATQTGYYAIQDSQSGGVKSKIFVLDNACKLTKTIEYPTQARDPEDAALDKNGTLYVADIGDNDENSGGTKEPRATVAIWTLAAGARQPTINRVAYPDGKKHDAEALLINGDGTPIIITKTSPSEVWVPEGPLVPSTDKNVPKLKKVGTFTAQETKTANPLGLLGWKLVTGAAASPDGKKVVIRTYSDAYEFDVSGGDVVKAITTGKPRITPLPNEAQGESITYTADGKNYVTASDVDATKKAPLLKYTPTDISAATGGGAGGNAAPKTTNKSFLQDLTLQDITYTVAAIGILGLALVIAGVIGIRRSRAARRAAGPSNTGAIRGAASAPMDEFNIPATVGGAQPYDDGPFAPPQQPGYGGRQPGPDRGSNVYGGGGSAPGGNVYGGGAGGGGGPDRGGYGPGGGGSDRGGSDRGGSDRGGNVYGAGGGGGGGGSDRGGPDRGGPDRGGYGPGGGSGSGGGGNVYGGGGGRGRGPDRGGYGYQAGYGDRGGYGRGDYDGYDRGYAPHR